MGSGGPDLGSYTRVTLAHQIEKSMKSQMETTMGLEFRMFKLVENHMGEKIEIKIETGVVMQPRTAKKKFTTFPIAADTCAAGVHHVEAAPCPKHT